MKKIFKISISLIIFSLPLSSFASVAVPWFATSTSQGWIMPTKINGVEQTVLGQTFNATSTTIASRFPLASSTLLSLVTGAYIPALLNLTTNGFVKTSGGTGALSVDTNTYLTGSGAGVTAVSISTANGFAGSSSGGATPALTLSTSITANVLKGNGTAISGAVNGTDYTLLTAQSCSAGSHISAATAAGVLTCTADSGSGGAGFGQAWEINSFSALAPTTTRGIYVFASSTIGNGNQNGGLTINGGATTTGNSYVKGTLTVDGVTTINNTTTIFGNVMSSGTLFGTGLQITGGGLMYFAGGTVINGNTNGNLLLTNNAQTDFSQLQLGGTSASFPSLKRDGTGVRIRLADNSGDASTTMLALTTTSTTATSTIQGPLSVDLASGSAPGNCWFCVASTTGNMRLIVDKISGNIGIATATPAWPISVYSTNAKQLGFSAGAGINGWVWGEDLNGNFQFSTTTIAGNATSSNPAAQLYATGQGLIVNYGNSGFGTTSPYATVSIQSGASTGDAFSVSTTTNTLIGGYDNDGHRFSGGGAPVISSCGTGTGTVVGDDQSGTITTATAATACTATFAKAYRATPVCTVTDNSLVGFADISSISTTAVTFGISSALTGGLLFYQCTYHK